MQILLGALAAFGFMCALWILFGLWLSGARGWAAVCYAGPEQTAALRRCRWLRSWGLLRGPILLVRREDAGKQPDVLAREWETVEICTLQALPARLELELEHVAGTGYADLTGNRCGGGISEL